MVNGKAKCTIKSEVEYILYVTRVQTKLLLNTAHKIAGYYHLRNIFAMYFFIHKDTDHLKFSLKHKLPFLS